MTDEEMALYLEAATEARLLLEKEIAKCALDIAELDLKVHRRLAEHNRQSCTDEDAVINAVAATIAKLAN